MHSLPLLRLLQVDVLVSEPMGTLLVNERMIESYIYARDHHLKPGGKMFPVSWRAMHRREEKGKGLFMLKCWAAFSPLMERLWQILG